MVFYQVIQERATQVSYLNLGLAAAAKLPKLTTPTDDTLASVCRLIAVDEAAHYHFFVETARLLLYYEPEESLDALIDVLRLFTMPARDIIPDYDTFGRALHDSGVFGRSIHYRDVVQVVLGALSAPALRELETGIRRAREIPAIDAPQRTAAFMDTLAFDEVERKVCHLYRRSRAHLERAGLADVTECNWTPAWMLSTDVERAWPV